MREWLTDDEGVLDDLSAPVGPDNRRPIDHTDAALPHRLPSPEEKAKAAASQVFPAEVVRLDVTGSGFERMTQFRRSLQHFEYVDASAAAGQANEAQRAVKGRKRSKKKSTKKRRNTIACDGDRNDIQHALTADTLNSNDGEKCGSRSSLRQRLNLVHLLRTSLMTTPSTGSKAASAGSALTSSDMSYDESDTNTQSMCNTTTDATSHASSELVVQVTAGNLVTATRTRSGAMMNTISRLRRLGTDHTFVSAPTAIQVDVHAPPHCNANAAAGDPKRVESNARDCDLYELIPSEKEFGTLGTARPAMRGVKLRGNKENKEDGRSSSGNWSASGSSCSTRASLDSDHPRHHHHHHQHHKATVSPLAQRHPRLVQQPQTARSFSPEMDADSALSGDDCSATTTSSIHRAENGHPNHNELDLETSSLYSCDAEGYYTSFHIDSGLKTLKEGQSDGSLHKNRTSVTVEKETNGSDRSSGMSSASGGSTCGQAMVVATPENEYELFGKGSTLSSATTSSAGTVIFRPDGLNSRKKRNSQPPEPPPRNGSNRNSVDSGQIRKLPELVSEAESKEIADALKQLRNNEVDTLHSPEAEPMRANLTQIERIPAMCVITPSITPLPSDEDFQDVAGTARATSLESHIQSAFLQQVAASDVRPAGRTRVNVADLPAAVPASTEATPIVIKASVVKCPTDQELVALSQLPTADSETIQPFSSAGSSESSRSSSLERKKRGARVTLDSDGKVVYSSDSLKRRKAQAGHSTFVEPGQNQERKLDPGTSAFRPNPIGSTGATVSHQSKPLSPPPYRPAPAFNSVRSSSTIPAVRTQPDGQSSSTGNGIPTIMVSRSDSYRLANVDDQVDNASDGAFQRNRSDSYRKANQTLSTAPVSSRLAPLSHTVSGFAVNGETRPRQMAGTGQFISGHLTDRWANNTGQPMNYAIKSPMLVKQISNPAFNAVQASSNARPSRQFYNRQVSSPAMMTSSPLLVKPTNGINNPNVAGRRIYGGPRLLVNPKIFSSPTHQNKSGSVSSLNSSGGSGLDISMTNKKSGLNGVPPSPVVRPPTNAQDRPSFFNITPDGDGITKLNGASSNNSSPLPGYQSLSPPPRMSSLPLAQLSTSTSAEFKRKDFRYNSLPARFKTVADYYASLTGRCSSLEPENHLPSPKSGNVERRTSTLPSPSKAAAMASRNGGRESPEEGGFLEFSAKRSNSFSSSTASGSPVNVQHQQQQGESSPTPSFSSCSLDGSFSTSSLNDSVDIRPGAWPLRPSDAAAPSSSSPQPKMVVHSIGLVKRTTISDFKRKLLQQLHHPASNKKISAVEQLKATQPPPAGIVKGGPPISPDISPVTKHPALENLIRRSARVSYIASRLSQQQQQRNNRFHPHYSPRTDVLSSTIAEGRSEEELAAADDDTATVSSATSSNGASVRRHLSFQANSRRGSSTPSSGSSTPIETSL
ncbi:serine-rich adhesin for platelets-like [Daphnia carinata]|uniref:serine-rich adhesin for platelets-like n=1 Tax=Daphnia carinata TaxID=120202 RepID=UPI00257B0790|nr:serine-rich adhesin for platelets-like [Daphnia carinata]